MYRVLLVDDDPILLSGIKCLIDWGKNNCQIAGTASNGNEALKKIKQFQPDIVLCDIAMPGISGLDIIEQAETQYPGIVFIMLTNHEEFEYVRKSLRYRAAEYLLKNSLTGEILEKALQRAIAERENRNKLYTAQAAGDTFSMKQRQDQITDTLAKFVFQNQTPLGTERSILIEEGMLSGFAFALVTINTSILPEYPGLSAEEKDKIIDWEKEIIGRLADSFFPNSILLQTPPEIPHIESDIDSPEIDHTQNDIDSDDLILFAWNLQGHTWDQDISRFRERLIKTSLQITRLGIEVIASEFFTSPDTVKNPVQILQQIKMQERAGKGSHPETIQKALQYILNNVEKRIMLQDVADFACISPGYLSTLFKKEYKQNLIDFINQTKIDRACELIKENKYRINEISTVLGYENAFYFSRVFRRHTGNTPSEYKEMILNR